MTAIEIDKGYEMTKTGVVFRRSLSDAEYDALGLKIANVANGVAWAIGDWLVAGTGRGPEGHAYGRAHDITGRSHDSLSQYSRVSLAFDHDERGLVPWSMYREALRLPAKQRVAALRLAKENNWNRTGLIDYMNLRLDISPSQRVSSHESGKHVRRIGQKGWRGNRVLKKDVRCPNCGHHFDVRRKSLSDGPVEAASQEQSTGDGANPNV